MSANPLAGVASVMGQLAAVWKGSPLITPPATHQPNRAERRRVGAKTAPTTSQRSQMRRRAQAAGYAAGRRGDDHRQPGVCPYTNRVLIDAWSAGYVDGRAKRKARP